MQTFIKGMARALDLSGTINRKKFEEELEKNGAERDRVALESDWKRIGNDLRGTLSDHRQKRNTRQG